MDFVKFITGLFDLLATLRDALKRPEDKNTWMLIKNLEAKQEFSLALTFLNTGHLLDANSHMEEAYRLFSELDDVTNVYRAEQYLQQIRQAGNEMATTRRTAFLAGQQFQRQLDWYDAQRTLPMRLPDRHKEGRK